MKKYIWALLMSLPALSLACVNLTGTYSVCRKLPSGKVDKVFISVNKKLMTLDRLTGNEINTQIFDLDNLSRVTSFNLDGRPVNVYTNAECDEHQIRFVTMVTSPAHQTRIITLRKDYLDQLVINETIRGVSMSETTCELKEIDNI